MSNHMEAAIAEAIKGISLNHGGPFGAVVVSKGKIIAKAHNMVVISKDPTMHAEVAAIRLASKKLNKFNLDDCELYTTCEPCPMCLGAILWSRIRKVHYGCTQNDAKVIGFDDKRFYSAFSIKQISINKLVSMKQIQREGCLYPFVEWARMKRKTKY